MFKSKVSTVRPKKKVAKRSLGYDTQKLLEGGVTIEDLKNAVKLPEGQNLYEWLSVNCFDFEETIQLVYSSVSDFCSDATCPVMNAGPAVEYLWVIDKKPTQVSAQKYCELLFVWICECFDNRKIFPEEFTDKPPKKFMDTITKIYRRLFRVFAHLFYSHMDHLKAVEMDGIALQTFKHFYLFCEEYKLLKPEDCEPLSKMIESISANK